MNSLAFAVIVICLYLFYYRISKKDSTLARCFLAAIVIWTLATFYDLLFSNNVVDETSPVASFFSRLSYALGLFTYTYALSIRYKAVLFVLPREIANLYKIIPFLLAISALLFLVCSILTGHAFLFVEKTSEESDYYSYMADMFWLASVSFNTILDLIVTSSFFVGFVKSKEYLKTEKTSSFFAAVYQSSYYYVALEFLLGILYIIAQWLSLVFYFLDPFGNLLVSLKFYLFLNFVAAMARANNSNNRSENPKEVSSNRVSVVHQKEVSSKDSKGVNGVHQKGSIKVESTKEKTGALNEISNGKLKSAQVDLDEIVVD